MRQQRRTPLSDLTHLFRAPLTDVPHSAPRTKCSSSAAVSAASKSTYIAPFPSPARRRWPLTYLGSFSWSQPSLPPLGAPLHRRRPQDIALLERRVGARSTLSSPIDQPTASTAALPLHPSEPAALKARIFTALLEFAARPTTRDSFFFSPPKLSPPLLPDFA